MKPKLKPTGPGLLELSQFQTAVLIVGFNSAKVQEGG